MSYDAEGASYSEGFLAGKNQTLKEVLDFAKKTWKDDKNGQPMQTTIKHLKQELEKFLGGKD